MFISPATFCRQHLDQQRYFRVCCCSSNVRLVIFQRHEGCFHAPLIKSDFRLRWTSSSVSKLFSGPSSGTFQSGSSLRGPLVVTCVNGRPEDAWQGREKDDNSSDDVEQYVRDFVNAQKANARDSTVRNRGPPPGRDPYEGGPRRDDFYDDRAVPDPRNPELGPFGREERGRPSGLNRQRPQGRYGQEPYGRPDRRGPAQGRSRPRRREDGYDDEADDYDDYDDDYDDYDEEDDEDDPRYRGQSRRPRAGPPPAARTRPSAQPPPPKQPQPQPQPPPPPMLDLDDAEQGWWRTGQPVLNAAIVDRQNAQHSTARSVIDSIPTDNAWWQKSNAPPGRTEPPGGSATAPAAPPTPAIQAPPPVSPHLTAPNYQPPAPAWSQDAAYQPYSAPPVVPPAAPNAAIAAARDAELAANAQMIQNLLEKMKVLEQQLEDKRSAAPSTDDKHESLHDLAAIELVTSAIAEARAATPPPADLPPPPPATVDGLFHGTPTPCSPSPPPRTPSPLPAAAVAVATETSAAEPHVVLSAATTTVPDGGAAAGAPGVRSGEEDEEKKRLVEEVATLRRRLDVEQRRSILAEEIALQVLQGGAQNIGLDSDDDGTTSNSSNTSLSGGKHWLQAVRDVQALWEHVAAHGATKLTERQLRRIRRQNEKLARRGGAVIRPTQAMLDMANSLAFAALLFHMDDSDDEEEDESEYREHHRQDGSATGDGPDGHAVQNRGKSAWDVIEQVEGARSDDHADDDPLVADTPETFFSAVDWGPQDVSSYH